MTEKKDPSVEYERFEKPTTDSEGKEYTIPMWYCTVVSSLIGTETIERRAKVNAESWAKMKRKEHKIEKARCKKRAAVRRRAAGLLSKVDHLRSGMYADDCGLDLIFEYVNDAVIGLEHFIVSINEDGTLYEGSDND